MNGPLSPDARVGAAILPRLRPGGPVPSAEYLAQYPPVGVIAFGRSPEDGATLDGLAELVHELRATMRELGHPEPFVCCDLEEGAGLHVSGATRLVPALALAAAECGRAERDEGGWSWIESAAALTAQEAREAGIELVLAPVCDVNTRRDNPIISVRSFGDDPESVARRARAFLDGLHIGGAGGCAKHFPGHGDTSADSHVELPSVDKPRDELERVELAPFRALVGQGEAPDAVMVAHLDVPALTGVHGIATSLSPRAVRGTLVDELGFEGCVLSDGIDMGGVLGTPNLHARALAAGCDGLLCPRDPAAAAAEILVAADSPDAEGRASWLDVERAGRRVRALRSRLRARRAAGGQEQTRLHPLVRRGSSADERARFADELAAASLAVTGGGWPWAPGSPYRLRVLGVDRDEPRRALAALDEGARGGDSDPLVVAVVCRVSAGHCRAGLTADQEAELRRLVADERAAGRPVGVLWFGSPQVVPADLDRGEGTGLLVGFAPSPPLVAAAGRFLRGEARAGGSLPVRLG